MTTITTEKIEELRELAKDKFADFRMSIKPAEAFALLDLAQRAMVPQPQDAIQPPDGKRFVDWALPESEYVPDFGLAVHEDEVKQYGQECYDAGRASQQPQGQALPELPEPFDRLVGHPAEGAPVFTEDQMHAYARAYASQLALPAGLVLTDDMVVRGAEALHDAIRAEGIDIEFDEHLTGTEIQQRIAESVFMAMASASPAVAEVDQHHFVQPVPDHCDRITWRNRYYHLPLNDGAKPVADEREGGAQ